SSNGSQLQAQTYLLAAVRYAEGSKSPAIAALAAYRLSLATVGGPAAGDTRGAKREAALSPADLTSQSDQGCAILADPAVLDRPDGVITKASLTCALERAQASGETTLAGLAALRLSRFLLETSQVVAPDAAAPLREAAGVTAVQALGSVSLASGSSNAELAGRLAEAAIDAGRVSDPSLPRAIAAMRAS